MQVLSYFGIVVRSILVTSNYRDTYAHNLTIVTTDKLIKY